MLAVQEVPLEQVNRYGIVAGAARRRPAAAHREHRGKTHAEKPPRAWAWLGATS